LCDCDTGQSRQNRTGREGQKKFVHD
jgi:hypothetical protein